MKQKATFRTVEECTVAMAARLTELTASVEAYNATESAADRDTIEAKVKDLKDAYNEASRCKVMLECLATGNPVLEACKRRYYGVIKTPVKQNDIGVKVMVTETDAKELDITTFNRTVLNAWFYRAELLCYDMTGDLVSGSYGGGGSGGTILLESRRFFGGATGQLIAKGGDTKPHPAFENGNDPEAGFRHLWRRPRQRYAQVLPRFRRSG